MKSLKKAQFWARALGFIPSVAAIFLSGSLAQKKATASSDIDFLIIAVPGRIWSARFWVFLILKLSFQLSKEHRHAQKICPNHFLTAQSLEIKEKNPYSAHLFSHNIPLFDPYNLFQDFREKNQWVGSFGCEFVQKGDGKKTQLKKKNKSLFERWIESIQVAKIKRNKEYQYPQAEIVLNDEEIRFHPKPKHRTWKSS